NTTATVTPSGGSTPYTYSWSPSGGIGAISTALTAGSYTCTITDANGCTTVRNITLTQPSALSATSTQGTIACNGGTATATVTPSGGTTPYTYAWSPSGGTAATSTALTAGSYACTITDANGCTTVRNITLTQPSALSATSTQGTIACNGGTATATVTPSGGSSPYTYAWSPSGGIGATSTSLTAGSYICTVTDVNGCTIVRNITLAQPSLLGASASSVPASCNISNGSATVVASGGTGPYGYAWSPSGGNGSTATGLSSGNYLVNVTDANGCTASANVIVASSSSPLASVSTISNVSCNGGSNGSVTLAVSGGVAPYTYAWSPSVSTTSSASGLTAGNYSVIITGSNGCTTTINIAITQPLALSATSIQGNIACNGGTTTATVTPSGGASPYSYAWSPSGGFAATSTALAAGSYSCTVTDANGCTAVRNITITQPSALSATSTQGTIACNGGTTTVTVTPSGGTTPYTYIWSPSGGTAAISNALTAGSYACTITDANGCTTVRNFTLTQPSALSATGTQGTIACNGGTANATVTPSGGISPYNYVWLPSGGTAATSTALTAGSYTCTITDANGCTTVRNITLTQPTALSVTSTQGTIACNGGTTTATVTPNGGAVPYTYAWTPSGGSGGTSNPLSAGSYTCTITDANGCSVIRNITLTQPILLSASASAVSATCNIPNGSASVVAAGGTAPLSYSWSPSGGTGATASGLNAGTYTVVVTDANGCTASASAIVNSSGSPQASVSSVTNVSCNGGNDGSASLTVTGGVLPYGYVWSPAVSTTSNANNLAAGNYTVTVSGADGCISTVNINIAQPSVLVATSTQGTIACNGGTTTATVTPSGGTSPYAYAWSPSGGTAATSTALAAGGYSCTITDANGCTTVRNITLTQPSALSATSTQGTIACNGGTATATVTPSGGTSPYTYAWSPSGGSATTSTALTAGIYTCFITDANGCTTIRNVTLTQPSVLSATTTQGTIACNGGTATATVNLSGGTSPYTYTWSPIGGTGATSSALVAGSYTCTISDANGCTAVGNITLTQPSALSVTSTQGTITCNGGIATATVTPSGGISPYNYVWSPNGGTGATSTALVAGNYSCTITDANGCTTIRNITFTQPSALSVTSTQGAIACNGGTTTATVNPSGGTAPYTYAWSPSGGSASTSTALVAGNYTCTITDANGCTSVRNITVTQPATLTVGATSNTASCGLANGSATANPSGGTQPYNYIWNPSGANTPTASGLIAGTYTVTINDANGCTATATTNVANVGSPSVTTSTVSNVSCFGLNNGSAGVSVSGGVAPYAYSWSPSGGNAANANALAAGSYTVLVTGANGCTASINISITQPSQLVLSANSTSVSCFGGSNGTASVSALGGTAPFTYSWSVIGGATVSINNIVAGNYSCLVTDAQGCTATASTSVSQPSALSLNINTTDVLCFNGSTGSATAIVNGGTPLYQYAWSGNISTNASVSGLSAQVYTCTITDGNGCTQTQSFNIGQPTPLQNSVVVVDAHCGQSDGSITLNTSGGVQPYAYTWSPTGSGSSLLNIAAGGYNFTITDLNGCTVSSSATVQDLPGVLASIGSSTNVACFGGSDGTAAISANGGTLPYAFSWSPNIGSSANVNGLSAGNYQVTVTDDNGCTSVVGVIISEPAQLILNATASVNVVCPGTSSNLAAVASGGLASYNYVWSPGNLVGANQSVVPQTSTNYTVLVTDANGCTQVASANVDVS
ncbi:MAG: beta strand repeat-containing protein, partial [Bacteroidota bacterium]